MKQLCCICYNVVMNYNVANDIKFVSSLLNLSFSQLADELNVARSTVNRIVKEETYPSDLFIESFYSFAYKNKFRPLRLNELKVQFAFDKYKKILFHGAKSPIDGDIDLSHSRNNIDVGKGFYLGESFEQAASYVFASKKSSVYIFECSKLAELKIKEFDVSFEWMLMVSYFRGQLDKYSKSPLLNKIIKEVEDVDVVIAPIADNNMYEIMNQFARGYLTDLQATSALSMSSLGKQYVLKTNKACECINEVDRLYLCNLERDDIEENSKEKALVSMDKSKLVIEANRRNGRYVEELLK